MSQLESQPAEGLMDRAFPELEWKSILSNKVGTVYLQRLCLSLGVDYESPSKKTTLIAQLAPLLAERHFTPQKVLQILKLQSWIDISASGFQAPLITPPASAAGSGPAGAAPGPEKSDGPTAPPMQLEVGSTGERSTAVLVTPGSTPAGPVAPFFDFESSLPPLMGMEPTVSPEACSLPPPKNHWPRPSLLTARSLKTTLRVRGLAVCPRLPPTQQTRNENSPRSGHTSSRPSSRPSSSSRQQQAQQRQAQQQQAQQQQAQQQAQQQVQQRQAQQRQAQQQQAQQQQAQQQQAQQQQQQAQQQQQQAQQQQAQQQQQQAQQQQAQQQQAQQQQAQQQQQQQRRQRQQQQQQQQAQQQAQQQPSSSRPSSSSSRPSSSRPSSSRPSSPSRRSTRPQRPRAAAGREDIETLLEPNAPDDVLDDILWQVPADWYCSGHRPLATPEPPPSPQRRIPAGVTNDDGQSCAYAATVQLLAGLRLRAPGPVEASLRGTPVLEPRHAAHQGPAGAYADASELMLAVLSAARRPDLFRASSRGLLCARSAERRHPGRPREHLPAGEQPGPLRVDKCSCGGQLRELSAVKPAPVLVVTVDKLAGVIARAFKTGRLEREGWPSFRLDQRRGPLRPLRDEEDRGGPPGQQLRRPPHPVSRPSGTAHPGYSTHLSSTIGPDSTGRPREQLLAPPVDRPASPADVSPSPSDQATTNTPEEEHQDHTGAPLNHNRPRSSEDFVIFYPGAARRWTGAQARRFRTSREGQAWAVFSSLEDATAARAGASTRGLVEGHGGAAQPPARGDEPTTPASAFNSQPHGEKAASPRGSRRRGPTGIPLTWAQVEALQPLRNARARTVRPIRPGMRGPASTLPPTNAMGYPPETVFILPNSMPMAQLTLSPMAAPFATKSGTTDNQPPSQCAAATSCLHLSRQAPNTPTGPPRHTSMEGKVPTLYLLSDRRRHVYVGTTVNLTHRVLQHNGLLVGGAQQTQGHRWHLLAACWGPPLEQIRQLEDLLHRPDSGCGFRKPVTVKQTVGALCSLLARLKLHRAHLHLVAPIRTDLATAVTGCTVTHGPLLHTFPPEAPTAGRGSSSTTSAGTPLRQRRPPRPEAAALSDQERTSLRAAATLTDPEAILEAVIPVLAQRTPARRPHPTRPPRPAGTSGPLRAARERVRRLQIRLRALGHATRRPQHAPPRLLLSWRKARANLATARHVLIMTVFLRRRGNLWQEALAQLPEARRKPDMASRAWKAGFVSSTSAGKRLLANPPPGLHADRARPRRVEAETREAQAQPLRDGRFAWVEPVTLDQEKDVSRAEAIVGEVGEAGEAGKTPSKSLKPTAGPGDATPSWTCVVFRAVRFPMVQWTPLLLRMSGWLTRVAPLVALPAPGSSSGRFAGGRSSSGAISTAAGAMER
ncbi:hypothetical protein PAPYR_10718 [Paratrimastix pyriformis]|uniref:GIY-YIG domain-containing protein n=1 Tax=Paratrimastix pyriformis TaxID=342808 RepID=A0ABQ8U946_9EUKA|nr:hypothetical protein PAPYR_10718 [Paratrimastix pyriformis]